MSKSIKALCVLAASVVTSWAMAEETQTMQQVHYQCERGVSVPVTYFNTDAGDSYAVVQIEGQQIPMQVETSASGARYVSTDAERGYIWHSKSDYGVLSWQAKDAAESAQDVIILRDCTVAKEGWLQQLKNL